jgi:hypothetical protein
MTLPRPSSCERARFLAALAPDATLSELEERMLSRHLVGCPACSSFARSVAGFTLELRLTPLVAQEFDVRTEFGRGRSRWSMKVPLVALTTAAAVLMTSVALRERPPAGSPSSSGPALIENAPVENEQAVLRQLRNISLAHRLESDRPSGQPGMYVG